MIGIVCFQTPLFELPLFLGLYNLKVSRFYLEKHCHLLVLLHLLESYCCFVVIVVIIVIVVLVIAAETDLKASDMATSESQKIIIKTDKILKQEMK